MSKVFKSTKSTETHIKSNRNRYSKNVSYIKPKKEKRRMTLQPFKDSKPAKEYTKKSAENEVIRTKAAKNSEFEIVHSVSYNLSLPALEISDFSSGTKAAETETDGSIPKKNTPTIPKKKVNNRQSKKIIYAIIAVIAGIFIIGAVTVAVTVQSVESTDKINEPSSTTTTSQTSIFSKSSYSQQSTYKIMNVSSKTRYESINIPSKTSFTEIFSEATSSHPSIFPPPPGSLKQLPNVTSICQQKHGMCFTARNKYQPLCSFAVCRSLHLQPKLIKFNSRIKLTFVYDGRWETIIETEPYTPCSRNSDEIGWCLEGICRIPDNDKHRRILQEYQMLEKIDGGWRDVEPNGEKCLKEFIKDSSLTNLQVDWNKYFENWYIDILKFRTCTKPLPQLDGRTCRNNTERVDNVGDWPFYVLDVCPQCSSILQCDSAIHQDLCKLKNHHFSEGHAKGKDFDACCFDNGTKPGRCILGECVPSV